MLITQHPEALARHVQGNFCYFTLDSLNKKRTPFPNISEAKLLILKTQTSQFFLLFVCFGESWRLHGVVSRHRTWPWHQLGSLVGGWRIHLASTWGASIGESSWESKRCVLFLRSLFSRHNGSRYKFPLCMRLLFFGGGSFQKVRMGLHEDNIFLGLFTASPVLNHS